MTEPVDPHISEDALANRTEGIRTALGETVVETAELKDSMDRLQLMAIIAAVLAALALALSVISLVFSLRASHKSNQNGSFISSLTQQEAASITDMQAQQCITDEHLLGFYSLDARKLYASGPTNYDQHYLKLQTSADHMKCGLAHVVPGS